MVLSGGSAPSIPAETWERITEAARELGYAPNRFAQALRTNRTMTIACIVPDITNPFYPTLMRGIQSVTDRAQLRRHRRQHRWLAGARAAFPRLVAAGPRRRRDRRVLHARAPRTSSRWSMPACRSSASNRRKKRGGDIAIDDIFVDSYAAAFAVTNYLIGRGHRRIAMVAGRGGPQGVRVEGYRAALSRGRRRAARRHRRGIHRDRRHARRRSGAGAAAMRRPRSLPPTT